MIEGRPSGAGRAFFCFILTGLLKVECLLMISKFSWKAYIPAFIIAALMAVLIFICIITPDPASAKLILPITPLVLFPVLALV